jgi:hypothetical protein
MKQTISLDRTHKIMVAKAMKFYQGSLQGMGKRLFDIAFNKVLEMGEDSVDLDGMEMIYVTQALNSYGKKLSSLKEYEGAACYRSLASHIEKTRISFQREHSPILKKKKAASAGTLPA